MRRVAVKFIPQVLKVKQKANHLFPATEVLQCTISDANVLGNMITGNKTWIYGNEPGKRPSNQFGNLLQHSHRKHAKLDVSHK
jgi:hypothetical protein